MNESIEETPEQRQHRLALEMLQLESALYPTLHQDLRRSEADTQFAIAKTATWAGGLDALAVGMTALAGGPVLIASIPAAVCFGLALHHLNKGIQLARGANAGSIISEPVWEGRLIEVPALVR